MANTVFQPRSKLVIDESIYEFQGKCPVKRYIPRKPHPNGLLTYAAAGYLLVASYAIPIVYDHEPYTLDRAVGPHEAMMRLLRRFCQRHQHIKPHLFVDSAFGSFERIREINSLGITSLR